MGLMQLIMEVDSEGVHVVGVVDDEGDGVDKYDGADGVDSR